MESLKKKYQDLMLSSDGCPNTDEHALKNEANVADNIDEEVKRLEEVMTDTGIEGIRKELSTNLDKWKGIGLHIAVTGSSGAGKSAFINAILDVCAEGKGGAEVGVTETTTDLTPYKHPKNPNFIVWDMPGVGTPKFLKEEYLTCVKFDRYDFFMILSKGRFTEEDLWLAKQIQERKKRFYFIRTNIDADIYNDSRENKKSHSAEMVMRKVYENCHTNLDKAEIKDPLVFLVDNYEREKYDFGRIEIQLLQDADRLKIEAMSLSLSTLTEEVLQKKRDVLEGRIAKKAMEIACLFGNESEQRLVFENEVSTYREQFNVDEDTLSTNKDVLNFSDEHLSEFQTLFKGINDDYFSRLFMNWKLYTVNRSLFDTIIRYLGFSSKSHGSRRYSRLVLEFSCIALHQNLEHSYKMALNVYDLNAQKRFVKSFMQN